ncbi:MAG: helix-turn-helix domain-containing protein [Streptosporangiaceae bacterium]
MADPVEIPGRDQRTRPLLREVIGRVLRRTRREQGRTLHDVARAARVSLPYLSELERGCKEASSEVLAAVCGALGIELTDLLAGAGRELAADRALAAGRGRRGTVIRLAGPAQPPQGCWPVDNGGPGEGSGPAQARGPADIRCLLAA